MLTRGSSSFGSVVSVSRCRTGAGASWSGATEGEKGWGGAVGDMGSHSVGMVWRGARAGSGSLWVSMVNTGSKVAGIWMGVAEPLDPTSALLRAQERGRE